MKTFVCDLDGCLLDTGQAFADVWSDILNYPVKPTDFNSWKHEWALGIDPKLNDEFWGRVWDETLYPFPGAIEFIKTVKAMQYKFVILTARSKVASKEVLESNMKPFGDLIDDVVISDHKRGEKKSQYINKMEDPWFFLDDHIKNVVDVKLYCPQLKDVMIFGGEDRPWNTSLDILGYRRITCYEDIIVRLIQEGQ